MNKVFDSIDTCGFSNIFIIRSTVFHEYRFVVSTNNFLPDRGVVVPTVRGARKRSEKKKHHDGAAGGA